MLEILLKISKSNMSFSQRFSKYKITLKFIGKLNEKDVRTKKIVGSLLVRDQNCTVLFSFADPARVVFTPSVQYIPRGLKGIIRCETDANPPITYITWKKDSRLFDPFSNAGMMALLNGSLLIDQVSIFGYLLTSVSLPSV